MKNSTFTICSALCLIFLFGFKSISEPVKTKVNYTIHGKGENKVIVLHSWMDDYESWLPTIPYLNLEQNSYAFIDVRGYGKSKQVKGNYTSNEIANDIFTVADELGWDKFYLVGHSMTGMAVQKAAILDTSNRILKIVDITPVSSAGFPVDDENLNFIKAIVQNQEVSNKAFRAFTNNQLSDTWYNKRAKRHVAVTAKQAQLEYIKMWTGENFANQMKDVKIPFLVMAGQYDHPAFKLESIRKGFEHLRSVEFLEIENSGHFPMQETPIYLAARIEEFINQ